MNMKRKNINIIIPLVVVLCCYFVAFLQGPGWTQQNDGNKEIPSSPKESKIWKTINRKQTGFFWKIQSKNPCPQRNSKIDEPQ